MNLQLKFLLKSNDKKTYFVKSEQSNPTLYIAQLPQYAEELKAQEKGIVFLGNNFIVGLFGKPEDIKLPEIEELAKAQSTKPSKVMKKDSVTFKFKEKGKKPIQAKGVSQFMISGQDFNIEKFGELLENQGLTNMDE